MSPAARLGRPPWWPGVLASALWALAILGLAAVAWLDQAGGLCPPILSAAIGAAILRYRL